jgi:hypothetical protein
MKAHEGVRWERVYTDNEYYDGPIFGVADYEGAPHVYDVQWNSHTQRYGPQCRLAEIEPDLLALVLEEWEIWLRWQAAHRDGLTTQDTHPALPSERPRYETLKAEIGDRLEAKRSGPVFRKGKFRVRDGSFEVLWTEV